MEKPPVPELLSFASFVGSCRFAPVAITRKQPIDIRLITASDLELRWEVFPRAKVTTDLCGVCDGLAPATSSECISDRPAVRIRAPQIKKTPAAVEPFADAKLKRMITAIPKDAAEM